MHLAFALLEPVVTPGREAPGAGSWIWLGLIAIGVVALIVSAARRSGKSGGRVPRTHRGGVGNAMQDLSAMLMPNRPDAAVIERIDEETHEDGRGDGRDPK